MFASFTSAVLCAGEGRGKDVLQRVWLVCHSAAENSINVAILAPEYLA